MIKRIQKTILKILEEELITVLAVSIVALGVFWVRAGTSVSTNLSFTVYPAEGSITVTAPNGGENWTVGNVYNITWTSAGPVNNVKIEIQRSAGGSWSEIIASTEDDGSHPWTVTSPATTTAKVKISKVGDDTVNDESNGTFTISSAGGGGGRHASPSLPTPGIYNVSPRAFTNNSSVELAVIGFNLDYGSKAFLGTTEVTVKYAFGNRMTLVVPTGFPLGSHVLYIKHPNGKEGNYGVPIVVYADAYEAFVVEQSDANLTMSPGSLTEAWVKLQNSSNYAWKRDGVNQINLGVVGDKTSIFYDPRTWVVPNRAARLVEKYEVKYGEVGTFRFLIKAPDELGEYDGFFAPVVENVKWLTAPEIKWHVKVGEEITPPTTGGEQYYSATWIRQSPYPTLNRGEEVTLWVELKNTGTIPWFSEGDNPVRLGASRPQDRLSSFRNGNWVLPNRPAVVNGLSAITADGHRIDPGQTGRFTFVIKAPLKAGRYREYFQPVAEYITWMEDWGVYWDITVRGVSRLPEVVWRSDEPSPQIQPPGTGGEVESKPQPISEFEPIDAKLFSDSIEKMFNSVFGYFGSLFSDLRSLFGDLP